MPSSKMAPFSFTDIEELRFQLGVVIDDIYSKLDYALQLDGKGVLSPLEYGGLGRDLSEVSAILGIANGESIDVAPLDDDGNLTDVTTLNATTDRHGFAPKGSGVATQFLNGNFNWIEALAASLFDANTILKADSDDTPVALTITEQTIVGRITGGVIAALSAMQVRTLINVEDAAVALATVKADADISDAISKKHTRQHPVDATDDHTIGSLTNTYLVKSDGSKLVPATNTDAQISAAVSASHAQNTDTTISITASSELTVSAGSVTVSGSMFYRQHTIDTESDAATDDLDTIDGGNNGEIMILAPQDAGRLVTLKDGTGNLFLNGDVVFATIYSSVGLRRTTPGWVELFRNMI